MIKNINKVCILINWVREFDMYKNFLKGFDVNLIDFIINDIKTSEKERHKISTDILKVLKKNKVNYNFFYKIYKKKKYNLIISTGQACSLNITIYSIFRFVYAKIFGRFLIITRIDKVFTRLFKRPFVADGKNCLIGEIWYPEKNLSDTVIKFPSGADLKLNNYPSNNIKKNFDIYFTNSAYEKKFLLKSTYNKTVLNIGYPRYFELPNKSLLKRKILKEFSIINKKKIIYWTPTHIHIEKEKFSNFFPWIDKISPLNREYNIIVRPHPKALRINPDIASLLISKGFIVDLKEDRSIGTLFKIADVILCDYGDSIFSAVYFTKPIILLNLNRDSEYLLMLEKSKSLDLKLRNSLLNFNIDVKLKIIKKKISKSLSKNYISVVKNINKKHFGHLNNVEKKNSIHKLLMSYIN